VIYLKHILPVFMLSGLSAMAQPYDWRNVEIGGGGIVFGDLCNPGLDSGESKR
jgi:hypothetical protein